MKETAQSLKDEAAALLKDAGWPEIGRSLSDILRRRPPAWVTLPRPLPKELRQRYRAALKRATRAALLAPRDAEALLLKAAAAFFLDRELTVAENAQAAQRLAPDSPLVNRWMSYWALKRGRPSEAREFARRSLEAEANSWGYCLRAEAAMRSGGAAEARRDLDESLRLDPTRLWAYVLRSELLRDMNRYDAALADLDRLVELHPYPWSYAIRARTAFNFRDQKKALKDLDHALTLDPNFREGRAYRGEASRRVGEFRRALKEFDLCLRGCPGFMTPRVRSWKGATLLALGKYKEAVVELSPVIVKQAEANIGWALAQRAQARLRLGRCDLAVGDMNRAVRVDPKSGWIYGRPGDAGTGTLDRYREVVSLFTRYLTRRPRWAWGYGWRGETHLRASRHAEALADLSRAVALSPREAWFHAWRGAARMGLGDLDGASSDFERAVRLNPGYASAHGSLADISMRRERYLEAKTRLDRYIKLEARSAWAYAWRGQCLVKCGECAAAKEDLETAVNLHTQYGDAWAWLAEAKRNLRDLRGAREAIDRALCLDGKKDLAFIVSGMIFADAGDAPAQLREFRKAEKLKPGLFGAASERKQAPR